MSRPSTWPFPAAEIHREATADPLDEARERILDAADEQALRAPRTDNIASGIYGARVGGDPADESEHFYRCAGCGQAVDMRDLGQVFHHEEPGHAPIRNDA